MNHTSYTLVNVAGVAALCLLAGVGIGGRLTSEIVLAQTEIETATTHCLNRMRAAMQAMEPHLIIAYTKYPDSEQWKAAHYFTADSLRAYWKAQQLWADVKRECWKQP